MSGNRGQRDSRPDPSNSRGNDSQRYENNPNQQSTQQLTNTLETRHLSPPTIPAVTWPASTASNQQHQQPSYPAWRPQQYPAPQPQLVVRQYQPNQPKSRATPKNPVSLMSKSCSPRDPSWTAGQNNQLKAYQKDGKRTDWNELASKVGGDRTPASCQRQWAKIQLKTKKEEQKAKDPKKDSGPDSGDEVVKAPQPRQRKRK